MVDLPDVDVFSHLPVLEQLALLETHLPGMVERDLPEAGTWLDVGLDLSFQLGEVALHADFLRLKGMLAAYKCFHLEAYQHLMEALQYARESDAALVQAEVYRWLGTVCTGMGHFHEALQWFEQGLQHTAEQGLSKHHLRIQVGMCWLYRHSNVPEQTVEYGEQVEAHALKNHLELELAFLHANVLEAHLDLYTQTHNIEHLEAAQRSLVAYQQLLKERSSARLLHFELYLQVKLELAHLRFEAAESHVQRMLFLLQDHPSDTLIGDAHLDLSVVRMHQQRWSEALTHLHLARGVFEQANARYGVMLTLKQEADLYEAQQNYPLAYRALKQYHQAFEAQERQKAREKSQMLSIQLQVKEIHQQLHDLQQTSQELQEQNALLHQQTHTLAQEAQQDTLTGLLNRRGFEAQCDRIRTDVLEAGKGVALVVLDIDHFKMVNDTFTHAVGDEVLKTVANLLKKHSRNHDVVARWGGEEFVLLLPHLDHQRGHQVCERFRRAIAQHDWRPLLKDRTVTVSLGFAVGQGDCSLTDMLHQADQQLYQAKHAGRNRVMPEG
ncbi:GGDEF domain-containing protein [Deinococcus misasensis]|uniref:GGDEF domain-containing protein n=1 Tax=Deinococcus misasensis TaxID=392413 RepID=UPI00068FB72B|nr:diguanylate cyclase [Deinococcus misasensis]